ncbi:MAG: hypothetical protein JNK78_14310 [Planctomycetes bacterium]|nr:hypothetical protein [Planctomycetota bacterium]
MPHLRTAVLFLAFAAPLGNAAPAQAPVTQERMDQARAENGKTVQQVDALLEQVSATQDAVARALAAAKASAGQLDGVGMERAARTTSELRQQLEVLNASLAERVVVLKELRGRLAAEAPAVAAADDPLQAMRDRLASADGASKTLPDVQKAIEQIERELAGKDWQGKPGVDELLGVVRFRLADVRMRRANVEIQKGKDEIASPLLAAALAGFQDVLEAPDSPNTGQGSSMHAVAMLRCVEIHATLYVFYWKAARVSKSSDDRNKCKRHGDGLVELRERLKRLHPFATLTDGSNVVAVSDARADWAKSQTSR